MIYWMGLPPPPQPCSFDETCQSTNVCFFSVFAPPQVQPKSERSPFALGPDGSPATVRRRRPDTGADERRVVSSGTRTVRTPDRVPAATAASGVPAARAAAAVDAATVQQQSHAGVGVRRRTFLPERQSHVQEPRPKRVRAFWKDAEPSRRQVALMFCFVLLMCAFINNRVLFFLPLCARRSTTNQLPKSFRGSQSSLQSRQSSEVVPLHMKDRPTSAYMSNKDSYNLQNQVRIAAVWIGPRIYHVIVVVVVVDRV